MGALVELQGSIDVPARQVAVRSRQELFGRHPDKALELAERSVAIYPDWDSTYWALVPAYVQLDRLPASPAQMAPFAVGNFLIQRKVRSVQSSLEATT